MNTKLCFLVLFLSISATFAWKLKDDYKYWEDQVHVIASKDLDSFADAVRTGGKVEIWAAIDDLKKAVDEAHSNNLRLNSVLGKFVGTIKSLSTGLAVTRIPRMNVIRLMAKAIDGNRDNKSYFLLDAAREWLERRMDKVEDGKPLKDLMKQAQAKVIAARDTLDGMAQVFVNGVKELIKLTENSRTNQEAIQKLAEDLVVNGHGATKLAQLGNDALQIIESMYKQA